VNRVMRPLREIDRERARTVPARRVSAYPGATGRVQVSWTWTSSLTTTYAVPWAVCRAKTS